LRYPAQLVSEALEDALKEMKDDAQPKEEPTLSAAWVPQDARAPSPIPPTEACRGAGEGQDPSKEAGDGEAPKAEEEAGEDVFQGVGSSTLRDGATSPPGSQPCDMTASLSAVESQEEAGAWEEEMPTVLSPREPDVVAQEEETSGPGLAGSSWEEPEQEEDEVEVTSMEASQPSEDEEERELHVEDGDFQGEGMDAREGGSLQREIEAAHALPVESHPVLPTESNLEEDLVDGGQEDFEHQAMPMCEVGLAAEEEREPETCPEPETSPETCPEPETYPEPETCPEQEPLSIHEAIPAEEVSSEAGEDAMGEENPGEGEEGGGSGEALGEDPWAGEAAGSEALGQESGAQEELGDLQENGFAEEVLEQELEPELGEEPWAETPEEPREVQDEDEELGSAPGQPESSSTGPAALEPVRGDSTEPAEEDVGRWGEPDGAPGVGRGVELEETLPDSTPLHLYEGEMLAVVTPSQNPPEMEGITETAPASETAPEDDGWLEGKDKPPSPTVPESREEEAGAEGGPGGEGAEEEEGYFMVAAPSQEVSSSEEAEMSEDFEEIKVEATEASKDDVEAPGEASPAPEDEGHFEAFVGGAEEDVKMPTEEPEMPQDEDEDAGGFTAELEEGPVVPEAEPSSPGAVGAAAGGTDEPTQGAAGPSAQRGPGCSEGLGAESDKELDGTAQLENDAGRAETLPGCDLELVGQEEEEEEDEAGTAHHDATESIPLAELQAQAMPVSPLPDQAEQTSDEQPSAEEEALEAPEGDSPLAAGDQEPAEADPRRLSPASEPGGFLEVVEEGPEVSDLAAKVTADVMEDTDILEIVDQALEFNQELVMGVRAAEGGQRDPDGTELPGDTGEDSSPASSSEEEPTVQEAPADAAPGPEGPVRAENGLHREASLEDLAEFSE
ncbi:PREDICTED: fibrous sheath CABYR-binding protein-like, partial [Eurypyga helias]|uniref:fibrous sheath CABYR-binding protein-like n=1 Tax=Eurypyga helias TaxID=54383 RepID=UPI00052929FE